MLTVMQLLRVAILNTEPTSKSESKKSNLKLSARSSLINHSITMKQLATGFPISGCIVSKEDHG